MIKSNNLSLFQNHLIFITNKQLDKKVLSLRTLIQSRHIFTEECIAI